MALDTLIQNRNASRVSNCMRGENCMWVICNVSGLNARVFVNTSFRACQPPPYVAGMELFIRTIDDFGFFVSFTRSSFTTNNSYLEVLGDTTLNITINQISNGVTFGVRGFE